MKKHIDKLIDKKLEARHERFKAIEELMNSFSRKKTKKLIRQKQDEISGALNSSYGINRDKDREYVIKLATSNEPDGSLLYEWDKKDAAGVENGGYKFSRIGEATKYKNTIRKSELALYERNADAISNVILHEQPQRIIDMGGGDGKETIEILNLLQKEAISNTTMTTKEISPYLAEEYKKNIGKRAKEKNVPLDTGLMYENFLDDRDLKSNKDGRVFLFPGGTIGNFEDDMLEQIKYTLTPENILGRRPIFMTFFVAPDKKSEKYDDEILKLKATYGDPDISNPYFDQEMHDAIKDWVMSGLSHWLGESVKDKLEFTVTYEEQGEKGGRILIGARVTEGFTIKVGNESFEKKPGDMIRGIQSRRFALPYFKELIEKGGYKMAWYDTEQGVGLTQIQTPYVNLDNISKQQEKQRKSIAKVFGMILLLGVGYYTIDLVRSHQAETEKEKQLYSKIDKELGIHQGVRGYRGESSGSIKSAWETVYQKYFIEMYGIEKIEKIKYDFIPWYVQERKSGRYVVGNLSYTDPLEIIEDYIAENGMRMEFDKNISFIPHPELKNKEDILYNTLQTNSTIFEKGGLYQERGAKGASTTGYYAGTKSYDIYKARSGMPYAYIIHEEDGKKYIVARELSSNLDSFSLEMGKKIAHDYFTPPRTIKMAHVLRKILKDQYHYDGYLDMEEKLIQLRMQGYKFDYGTLLKTDENGLNASYFLCTFFPEFHIKDTTSSMEYDLSSSINAAIEAIAEFDISLRTNTIKRNEIAGNMFNTMIREPLPGFMTTEHTLNKRHMKEWIVANYQDIIGDNQSNFPFIYTKGFPETGVLSNFGSFSEKSAVEAIDGYDQLRFEEKGIYRTKDGIEIHWGLIDESRSEKILMGTCENKAIRDAHIASLTKEYTSTGKFYGWRPEDIKILQDGRIPQNVNKYDHISDVRRRSLSTIDKALFFPNTYYGKMMYEDWLNK